MTNGQSTAISSGAWQSFYIFLFAYRCAMSILGHFFVAGFTSLGDTGKYQRNYLRDSVDGWWLDSTRLTELVGFLLNRLLASNPILINIGFQSIAFIGIYALLRSLPEEKRKILAIFLLLPSFNLWTSVASKEAIIVFGVGLLLAYLVNTLERRGRLSPFLFLAGIIVFIYKPHYLPALAFLWGSVKLTQGLRRPLTAITIAGVVSLIPLYIFSDILENLSKQILPHFLGGGSSRGAFWVEKYDVFWRAPYGMFQSFYGPTIHEFLEFRTPLVSFSFIESGVLIFLVFFLLARSGHRLPLTNLVVSFMSLFWLLFANYPFGVMNPGSAIRYRSGYYLIVCVIIILFFSVDSYRRRRDRNGRTTTPVDRLAIAQPPAD